MKRQPKNNLAEVLQQSEGDLHAPLETPEPEPKSVEAENGSPPKTPSTRQGTKVIMGHFPEEVHTQVQYLRIETKRNVQDLVAEALNLLFTKYDKPPIA